MLIKLTDIKNPAKGAYHCQYWFTWPEGQFLSDRAVRPPYYEYLTRPGARFRRWMRIYQVDLPVGAQLCRYVQRGYTRVYLVYCLTVEEDHAILLRVDSSRGVPPWMKKHEQPGSRDS